MRDNYNHGQILLENAQNMILRKTCRINVSNSIPPVNLENGKMQACAR